ncbi:hypothetical protein E9993_04825 [Labilibacter sediminis]|nr:hypothetical protein E9993_04825 [Labilibacter sediminis]
MISHRLHFSFVYMQLAYGYCCGLYTISIAFDLIFYIKAKYMQKQSVIILGHGSKSAHAIEDFNYVVNILKQKMDHPFVFGAHMEMAQPSLEEVVENMNNEGVEKVTILPYFLFNGNHIKEDIPEKIELLEKAYPGINFSFGTPIGKEPMMADIMLKKVLELA